MHQHRYSTDGSALSDTLIGETPSVGSPEKYLYLEYRFLDVLTSYKHGCSRMRHVPPPHPVVRLEEFSPTMLFNRNMPLLIPHSTHRISNGLRRWNQRKRLLFLSPLRFRTCMHSISISSLKAGSLLLLSLRYASYRTRSRILYIKPEATAYSGRTSPGSRVILPPHQQSEHAVQLRESKHG